MPICVDCTNPVLDTRNAAALEQHERINYGMKKVHADPCFLVSYLDWPETGKVKNEA